MKLKIEVKSYNNYPPHTHTSGGGGGLLDLPCTQGQLLMDAKLFNGTTKYQKLLLYSKVTYLDYIKLHGVQGNLSGIVAGSFASMPKIVTCVPHLFSSFFSLPLIQEKQPVSYWLNKKFAK